MSTVKDVAEHCGETIHRLRALIRAEAGEDGKSLGADTIGELRGLVETIADLDRMLKRVTDVERDPDVLDVTQIYALLDETPHDRAGDVLRVHALDERKDGSLKHGTPADPDYRSGVWPDCDLLGLAVQLRATDVVHRSRMRRTHPLPE